MKLKKVSYVVNMMGGMMNNEFVPAYRNEPNVNSQSNTETFVAGKIEIENSKWASVTFYIRTEKKNEKNLSKSL